MGEEFKWKYFDEKEQDVRGCIAWCKYKDFELSIYKETISDHDNPAVFTYDIYSGKIGYNPLKTVIYNTKHHQPSKTDVAKLLEDQTEKFYQNLIDYSCQPNHWG